MTMAYHGATILSVIVFLFYGIACVFANGMVSEFERYGLSRLRVLTGSLEILGALGLVVGQWIPALVVISAGGLSLLMVLGVYTRVRVRDGLRDTLPAGVLMVLNAFIAAFALELLRA